MRFSTLDADSYSFADVSFLDLAGEAISISSGLTIKRIWFANSSGAEVICRINGKAPFPVPNGSIFEYEIHEVVNRIEANGVVRVWAN